MIGIQTNLDSQAATRASDQAQRAISKTLSRLASGHRINNAGDDASGLSLAKQFEAEVRSTQQASRNANDAASVLQTADAGLEQIGEALGRMQELAVQSANGTLSDADRAGIDAEFSSLSAEINRISDSTSFNGTHLLNGSASLTFQVGSQDGDTITVSTADANTSAIGGPAGSTLSDQTLSTASQATRALGSISQAISDVSAARGRLGAGVNRLTMAADNLAARRANILESKSRILDADVAEETSKLTLSKVRQNFGAALQAQANVSPQAAISLLRR